MLVAMLLTGGLAAGGRTAYAGETVPIALAYVLLEAEQLVLFPRARA
jgi:hypothetical protein